MATVAALDKVANAIGEKYGIQVVFKGSQAATDGKQIVLPALPEGEIDDETAVKTKGLCDHEIGHLKFSEFGNIFKRIGRMKNAKQVKSVTNCLEDIRIERAMSNEYIGAKENMEAAMATYFKGAVDNPWMKLAVAGRNVLCGYELPGDYVDECKREFGADIFDRLGACKSSSDCLKLALELLALDDHGMPKQPSDLPAKEGEKKEGGENGEGKGQGKAKSKDKEKDGEKDKGKDKGEEENGSDGEGEGSKGEGENKDGKAGTSAEQSGSEEGQGHDASEANMHNGSHPDCDSSSGTRNSKALLDAAQYAECPYEEIKKDLENKHNMALGLKHMVMDKSEDQIVTVPPAYSMEHFNSLRSSITGLTAAGAKMSTMFLAKTESKWVQDREQGKINARALAKVPCGYKNVYKEKLVSRDRDTAICLLNDNSGSMMGSKVQAAMKATILFLETLNKAKIKTEVLGYTTGDHMGYSKGDYDTAYQKMNFGRVEALRTFVYKTYDEPYNGIVKRRIGNYGMVNMNNNVDPDSLEVAYERIIRRKEARKIIFVLTDGAVNSAGNNGLARARLRELVKQYKKQGKVEIVAVAIGTADDAKRYYDNVISVDCCGSNLAQKILGGLKEIMFGKGCH